MPTLQFITGSGSGSTVAQGVVGQIAALNNSIASLNYLVSQIAATGAANVNNLATVNTINFYLNGKYVTVTNPNPNLTLVDYLRYSTPYIGTKKQCNQGGCGICAVMMSYFDSDSNVIRNVSVNACLRLLVNCDGMAIWTTEGIKPAGANNYHPVQERIAKTYGLQCGACTAGMVMTTYSALQPNGFITVNDNTVEKLFDGNLCRCSCYYGIIKMARSFVTTSNIYNSSGALIGYNLSNTGALVTASNLTSLKATAIPNINSNLNSNKAYISSGSYTNMSAVISSTGSWTVNTNSFITNTLLPSVSIIDMYNTVKAYDTMLITDLTSSLITLGVATGTNGTTGANAALRAYKGQTGAWGPLSSLLSSTFDKVLSTLSSYGTGALPIIATGASLASTAISTSITNLETQNVFSAGSVGESVTSVVATNNVNAIFNLLTAWANNNPSLPGDSIYGVGTMANDTSFTAYTPSTDVNGNSGLIASFLQTYTKQPALFTAPAPYNYTYYRPQNITDASNSIMYAGLSKSQLVAAGTSFGVPGYERNSTVTNYIDINSIASLKAVSTGSNGSYTFGANVPLNKISSILSASSDSKLQKIATHINYIAGQHVRNAASWVGGLAMAKKDGFASDVAPLLVAANATLSVQYVFSSYTQTATISVKDYLNTDLSDRFVIILSVTIPASVAGEFFDSYRVAQRYYNAHALLNNAFSITMTGANNTITSCTLVYGATVNAVPVVATGAMAYLIGKQITGTGAQLNTILSGVIPLLSQVPINADPNYASAQYPDGKTPYRTSLVSSLFYMSFLKMLRQLGGFSANAELAKNIAGIEDWISSSGKPTSTTYEYYYDQVPDFKLFPLHFPMPKWGSKEIAAGIAKYNDDLSTPTSVLFGAIVGSTIAKGSVDFTSPITINALATARATPGVSAVITSVEMAAISTNVDQSEQIIAGSSILYYGHPVALVLATSQDLAYKVASTITFGYTNIGTFPTTILGARNSGALQPSGLLKQLYNIAGYISAPIAPYIHGDGGLELSSQFANYSSTGGNLIPIAGYYSTGSYNGQPYWTDSTGANHIWSPYIFTGSVYSGDNVHFSMEKQTQYAYIDDMGILQLYGSLQYPRGAYNALLTTFALSGLTANRLNIKVKRIGGAFGEKLNFHARKWASLAVAAVLYTKQPVKLVPTLQSQLQMEGARSDILWNYSLGFSPSGAINSLNYTCTFADGVPGSFLTGLLAGEILGGNIMLETIPNSVSNFDVALMPRPPRCPLRSFGHAQAAFLHASIIDKVMAVTGLTSAEVELQNLNASTTGANAVYRQLFNTLLTDSKYNYSNRVAAINTFNTNNKWKKRGIEMQQHIYIVNKGFSFAAKDSYARIKPDGSVYFWACLTDSGQGANPKVLQALSQRLRCPLSSIYLQDFDTQVHAGDGANGGSQGSQYVMYMAAMVADKLNIKLNTRVGQNEAGEDIVVDASGNPILDVNGRQYNLTQGVQNNDATAWNKLVSLFSIVSAPTAPVGQAAPTYSTSLFPGQLTNVVTKGPSNDLVAIGNDDQYNCGPVPVYFASMSEVEVDILTGNIQILETDVVYDIGESANRSIDMGQLEGGYIFGMGYFFKEERLYDVNAKMLTVDTWEYKPAITADLPQKIKVEFVENSSAYAQRADPAAQPFPFGSKASQEMAVMPVASAFAAVKSAIRNHRVSNGLSADFVLDIPATPDRIKQACGTLTLTL